MNPKLRLDKALADGRKFLKENNISEYLLDAEVILMYVTGFSKIEMFTKNNCILEELESITYENLLKKRADGVPTQYIVGECEFMSLPFFVDENVLIPRSDTEVLVEEVLKSIDFFGIKTIIDIGTGSGCIPISLVHYGDVFAYAVDISENALEVAKKNAHINNVEDKIKFIQSDLFENIPKELFGKIDALVSNPPYIPTSDIKGLMKEVCEHEPFTALDGGLDGLDFYRKIALASKDLIKRNGHIFFEIGFNQGLEVSEILEINGFIDIKVIKDLSGHDRVVYGRLN